MIKVSNISVSNLDNAIRGMRNPLNSWSKSDSKWIINDNFDKEFVVGENDLELMRRLYKAGPEHSKYLRFCHVCLDIECDSFVWAEIDTYKIGTSRDSCSFQHKGTSRPFEFEMFGHEYLDQSHEDAWDIVICELNRLRDLYLRTKDYEYFRRIRQLLPSGWLIKATYDMNYANVMNMINQRENHKLKEWQEFTEVLRELPYIKEIRGEE